MSHNLKNQPNITTSIQPNHLEIYVTIVGVLVQLSFFFLKKKVPFIYLFISLLLMAPPAAHKNKKATPTNATRKKRWRKI